MACAKGAIVARPGTCPKRPSEMRGRGDARAPFDALRHAGDARELVELVARRAERTAEEEPFLRRDRAVGADSAARACRAPAFLAYGRSIHDREERAADGRRLDGEATSSVVT